MNNTTVILVILLCVSLIAVVALLYALHISQSKTTPTPTPTPQYRQYTITPPQARQQYNPAAPTYTPFPTRTPTPSPTVKPTATLRPTATAQPTRTPTPSPTPSPTFRPTRTPHPPIDVSEKPISHDTLVKLSYVPYLQLIREYEDKLTEEEWDNVRLLSINRVHPNNRSPDFTYKTFPTRQAEERAEEARKEAEIAAQRRARDQRHEQRLATRTAHERCLTKFYDYEEAEKLNIKGRLFKGASRWQIAVDPPEDCPRYRGPVTPTTPFERYWLRHKGWCYEHRDILGEVTQMPRVEYIRIKSKSYKVTCTLEDGGVEKCRSNMPQDVWQGYQHNHNTLLPEDEKPGCTNKSPITVPSTYKKPPGTQYAN